MFLHQEKIDTDYILKKREETILFSQTGSVLAKSKFGLGFCMALSVGKKDLVVNVVSHVPQGN